MQVLAINGSPRGAGGITALILRPFLEGMEERVELIHTKELLSRVPELIKIYHTTGECSILAIGLFDSNELTKFINHKLLVDFSVQKYAVDVVTKQYKDSIYMI